MTSPLFIKCLGRGEPFLLLHGWGCDHRVWQTLLPFLTQQYQVILIDLPGFGESSWMSWENFKMHLLQKFSLPCRLLGWSLGGLYAMRLAIECPQHINHLTLVASSPKILATSTWPGLSQTIWCNFTKRFQADPKTTCQTFFKRYFMKQGLLVTQMNPITFQQGLSILETWDLRRALHQVKGGHFIFGGRDDIIVPQTYYTMKQLYPQFQIDLFQNAGHSVFLSHLDAFLKIL